MAGAAGKQAIPWTGDCCYRGGRRKALSAGASALSLASARSLKLPAGCYGGLVRKAGLEPARLAALEPKSRASTNSATFAGAGHRAGAAAF